VIEVARYFWQGIEQTIDEYAWCLATDQIYQNHDPCLNAINEYVTHLREIKSIILGFSVDGCYHSCQTHFGEKQSD
jgi:hypothetical protein